MHSPYIVNVKHSVEEVTTTEEAEGYAENFLIDEGFVGQGHFGGGRCDWFHTGGNFTHLLNGKAAVRFEGQQELIDLCKKLSEDNDYIDTDYNEEEINLEEGDIVVVIDYHL